MCRFKRSILIKIIIGLLVFILWSCSPQSLQKIKSKALYKRNLSFAVNGESFRGIGVPKKNKSYKIEIQAPFNLDYVKIESCHREHILENAYIKKRILKNRKKYEFVYKPIGIEKECILILTVLSKKGKYHFGQVAFNTKEYKAKALNYCNGKTIKSDGVSMCQSKKGLIQLIEFENQMKPQSNCEIHSVDGKVFKYDITAGDCVFLFLGRNKLHKLVTWGYEDFILEE
tara:strand:- start:56 stop:742 length:687 start_codon:yes stop_codon:yes gene_type:complete